MNPVVTTQYGKVRGSVADGVNVFKGIPYAAPPFGANRLRPPQPVEPWSGVRDALTYGPKQPQPPYPPGWDSFIPELAVPGEDCLNLNIWSPDLGAARLPVMVWIHGGVFELGTAATTFYDGSRFARDGIVCVTINYRVGADGFLSLGEGNANRGLLDQIAALEWVRENIAAFGGDPANVTVFGQSAGGKSITSLLAMPHVEGLFRRAIAESGAAYPVMSAASAQRVAAILAAKLGVAATREAIAAVPLDRMLQAQAELKADLIAHPDPERWGADVVVSKAPWHPVIDGDILPAPPLDRIAAGAGAGIDLMVGSNHDEWNLFLVPSGAIERVTAEALAGAVAAYGLPVESTLAAYRAEHQDASSGELLSAIQSDWFFRIPVLHMADAHAKSPAATYMYEFAWRSPQFDGRLGACHGLEVPFVFDTLGYRTEPMLGTEPPQQLADTMHAAWVAFATRGDPGWPRYELSHRATMRFDRTSEVVDDPRSTVRVLWEDLQ
ncbi:MAG TPA: carboxylesterase/lipase family protein [Ktedonobacterales bacterium]